MQMVNHSVFCKSFSPVPGLCTRVSGLKKWLGIASVGASMLVPVKTPAAGYLRVYNHSPNSGISDNYIAFPEDYPDGAYLGLPAPSMEIYYLDSEGNKHSTASVILNTNKYYDCPLEYNGGIPNGATNNIVFRIMTDWPCNTYCSALIQTDSGYSNFISDVLGYTQANSNSSGYAFIALPNITNAVSGQIYGSVKIRFAPTFNVQIQGGEAHEIAPTNFSDVPHGGSVTVGVGRIYVTNAPGSREKFTGFLKTQ